MEAPDIVGDQWIDLGFGRNKRSGEFTLFFLYGKEMRISICLDYGCN